jgi:hypothetical protein
VYKLSSINYDEEYIEEVYRDQQGVHQVITSLASEPRSQKS